MDEGKQLTKLKQELRSVLKERKVGLDDLTQMGTQ